jgi:hypothetical protein
MADYTENKVCWHFRGRTDPMPWIHTLSLFMAKCLELERRGIRFSVGVVGLKQHAEEIEAL